MPFKKTIILFIILSTHLSCVQSQEKADFKPRLVGGPCEGCEAVFEFGEGKLDAVDTLPDFDEEGEQLMLTGTIFQADGVTPANDVILYVYHTDGNGIYPTKGSETGWARRHGYIRGWIRTSADGRYTFYTLKPGTYPDRSQPAHIHPTILEPDGKYYWIRDFLFRDDPLIPKEDLNRKNTRGGSTGILTLERQGKLWVGRQDIILGRNIPGYK